MGTRHREVLPSGIFSAFSCLPTKFYQKAVSSPMKRFTASLVFLFLLLAMIRCSEEEPVKDIPEANEAATKWADLTLKIVQNSFPGSPTYTSRSLGYLGVAMYESVVHGSAIHHSIASQLNGLTGLPEPIVGQDYNWTIALNAGQAFLLKKLYPHMPIEMIVEVDLLEATISDYEVKKSGTSTARASAEFGKEVAAAIYDWSLNDGGHEGYLHHFDPDFIFPTGDSYWIPPVSGQVITSYPLHPYWGNNRTFVPANSTIPVPEILPYSTETGIAYYNQFREVYDKVTNLTSEEKNIAAWWADDPSQTASPPGHSYNLASIAIKSSHADLYTAAEVYAKVGMSTADAFINCWKTKYTYHAERPFPYIKKYIDPNYTGFWPEPPFPSFSSGHATQSAAAAVSLISVFGNDVQLTDNTHENRMVDFPTISYQSRRFNTIWETAEECAMSRFYGGIHTRQDNESGTLHGKSIAENIVALHWKN